MECDLLQLTFAGFWRSPNDTKIKEKFGFTKYAGNYIFQIINKKSLLGGIDGVQVFINGDKN
jgi:hypothetical protein